MYIHVYAYVFMYLGGTEHRALFPAEDSKIVSEKSNSFSFRKSFTEKHGNQST